MPARAREPDGVEVGTAPGWVVRWRTLPDYLSTTLGVGRSDGGAAGLPRSGRGEERGGTCGEAGEAGEAILLAPAATIQAEFATPAGRMADFPAVRLVRARCRLRAGERRCAATCPPGGVVIGGGHEAISPRATLGGSAPAGDDAWAVEVCATTDGEPVRVAVWAMCV